MEEKEIIELIDRFYSDENYAELKRIYSTRSFPDILGIGRKEMAHSAFIAWLLDPHESHGLGDFPLKQFFKILVKRDLHQGWNRHRCGKKHCLLDDCSIWSKCSTKEIAACVMNESTHFSNIKVDIERTTEDNKDGRIDIIIEGKMNNEDFRLIIENKIYSKENNKQTDTYFKNYFDKSTRTLFVFLTPIFQEELDNINEPQCECKQFIQINYQDILDKILEPILKLDYSERTKFIIKEYINCLCYMSNNKPMATSNAVSPILTQFWDKNQELILAILDNINNDKNQDPELRETAGELAKANRLTNRVKYKYEGVIYTCGLLVRKIVEDLIINGNEKAAESLLSDAKNIDKKRFGDIKTQINEKMAADGEEDIVPLINKELLLFNPKEEDRKTEGGKIIYSQIEGTDYFVYNQWSFHNIDSFLFALSNTDRDIYNKIEH